MGKRTLMLMFLLIMPITSSSASDFTEGYQNAKWGMSLEQVKAAFPNMDFKTDSDGTPFFLSTISGENVQIGFQFVERKLYQTGVLIQIKTTNKKTYISKFDEFESLLKKKYGEPKQKARKGSDNQFIDDATAISTGEGAYFSEWDTPESIIQLVLFGDNFTLGLMIRYECKALAVIAKKLNEEKAVKQL
ncbi:MAG: hypothetical protein ABH891_07145 [Candidatus Omnitrophota bacterium]